MSNIPLDRRWTPSNAAATLIFWPLFCNTLLVFDCMQRFALLYGREAHERCVVRLNRALIEVLRVIGTKIEVHGLPPDRIEHPLIILSNHQSLFDIPILHTIFAAHRPRYVAKSELSQWIPSISLNLRRGGNALIDRSRASQAVATIKDLGQQMRQHGFATVLFPESTRAQDGEMRRFRSLGLAALLEACPQARILPVTIEGSWELARYKLFPIAARRRIRVVIGPLLEECGMIREKIRGAEEEISRTLNMLRERTA